MARGPIVVQLRGCSLFSIASLNIAVEPKHADRFDLCD